MSDAPIKPVVVELGPSTLAKLATLIEDAVAKGFDRVFVPPEEDVTLRDISPLAVDEIKRAIHEVLDERTDDVAGEDDPAG